MEKILRSLLVVTLVMLAAACVAPTPQVIEKQVEVQVTTVVEKEVPVEVIKEVVVTPTPEPAPAAPGLPLDKLRISLSGKIANLDSTKPGIQPDQVTTYLTAGRLFRLLEDWSVEPELAESMTVSPDGLTATVKLKPDLKYSEGTPIKAEDFVYAFQRQRDLKGTWWVIVSGITDAEAPDDTTVVFKMEKPFANLPIALSHMSMSAHPKAQIEADPDYFAHPVSSGQYILKDWVPGSAQWTLGENPNYYAGPPAVRELEMVAIPDLTSRVLQLTTGAVDFVYDLPVAARDSFPPEVKTTPVNINGMYHVVFNGSLPDDHPLRNADVRKAISMAIDRDEVSQKAFFGISKPAKGFLYEGVPAALDILPNGGKRDMEAAKALLATTPFADGFTFTLQPWSRPGWTDAALVIKKNLADIGITVEVQPIEDAVAGANLKSGNYEAQFSGNASDPLTLLRNQFVAGSYWADVARYNNPEVIRLLDEARNAATPEQAVQLMQDAQKLAYEDMPLIPISERAVLVGSRLDDKIISVANRPPGVNPIIGTLADASE